jgi:signal peptidase I
MRFQAFLLVFLGSLCASAIAGEKTSWDLFKYKTFREPGMAMEPAIAPGDVIYVDMAYFGANQPRVGDVVLYKAKSLKNGPTAKGIWGQVYLFGKSSTRLPLPDCDASSRLRPKKPGR